MEAIFDLVAASAQGRTHFLQKRECCAGALEGRFIATLAKLNNAKTVLEVGMFTGTTTLAVAQALPDDGKVREIPPIFFWDCLARLRCTLRHVMKLQKLAPEARLDYVHEIVKLRRLCLLWSHRCWICMSQDCQSNLSWVLQDSN